MAPNIYPVLRKWLWWKLWWNWTKHRRIQAIFIYVKWYRHKCDIKIGSQHYGGDDMGAMGEMIELLARAEFGTGDWSDLTDVKTRDELYAHVVYAVLWYRDHDEIVDGWVQPAWEASVEARELVKYVFDFRCYHEFNLSQPREFRVDDLEPEGQFILRELVPTINLSGPWERLADAKFAESLLDYVRKVLRPRLDAYVARKRAGAA